MIDHRSERSRLGAREGGAADGGVVGPARRGGLLRAMPRSLLVLALLAVAVDPIGKPVRVVLLGSALWCARPALARLWARAHHRWLQPGTLGNALVIVSRAVAVAFRRESMLTMALWRLAPLALALALLSFGIVRLAERRLSPDGALALGGLTLVQLGYAIGILTPWGEPGWKRSVARGRRKDF